MKKDWQNQWQNLLREANEMIDIYHKLSKRKRKKRKNWEAFKYLVRRKERLEKLLKDDYACYNK